MAQEKMDEQREAGQRVLAQGMEMDKLDRGRAIKIFGYKPVSIFAYW